jgi:AcrR family transcriptional regulator
MATPELPARPNRAQQKEATRSRILKVAKRTLEQQGFEATGIREIAAECGVAAGTVLLHFRDKQDLLLSCFFDDFQRRLTDAFGTASRVSLEEDLVELFAALLDFHLTRPKLAPVLLRETWFAAAPWKDQIDAQNKVLKQHIEKLALEAQERGDLSPRATPELIADAFFSFYRHVVLGWIENPATAPDTSFRALLHEYLSPKKKLKGKKDKKHKNKKTKKHGDPR